MGDEVFERIGNESEDMTDFFVHVAFNWTHVLFFPLAASPELKKHVGSFHTR